MRTITIEIPDFLVYHAAECALSDAPGEELSALSSLANDKLHDFADELEESVVAAYDEGDEAARERIGSIANTARYVILMDMLAFHSETFRDLVLTSVAEFRKAAG